jgi:hypothetical protein
VSRKYATENPVQVPEKIGVQVYSAGAVASMKASIMKDAIDGWPIWIRGRLPLDELRECVKTPGRRAQWPTWLVLAI